MAVKPTYTYRAALERVVDGDTIDITIDLGFRVGTNQRVRLEGINAPERNTAEGQAAIKYLQEWFGPTLRPLVIESSKPGGGDKYGRFLARIYEGTRCLNDDLVKSGHAFAWDGQGSKPVGA